MGEDLPLHRHAALMSWMGFIIGTVVLLTIPGVIYNHNRLQALHAAAASEVSTTQLTDQKQDFSKTAVENDPLFRSIIQEASDRYEIEPELIHAIIMAESSYNPTAVSRKGARGLMQLMPSTAKALGVKDSFNPEHNIDGGVRYFRQLLDRFGGDVKMALAAYNAGSRKVREYKGVPPFASTRYYINRVFSYYNRYKDAGQA